MEEKGGNDEGSMEIANRLIALHNTFCIHLHIKESAPRSDRRSVDISTHGGTNKLSCRGRFAPENINKIIRTWVLNANYIMQKTYIQKDFLPCFDVEKCILNSTILIIYCIRNISSAKCV